MPVNSLSRYDAIYGEIPRVSPGSDLVRNRITCILPTFLPSSARLRNHLYICRTLFLK